MLEEKVIRLSKTKIVFLLILAILFVMAGAWMLSLDAENLDHSPIFVYGIGGACVVFFGLCGFVAVRKLFDSAPGLILNSDGIVDNSSGISAGLIPWEDISGIAEYSVQRQKFVSILLKEPEKYAQSSNILKRMAQRANIKTCGTPISISANSLKINYDELLQIIAHYHRKSMEPDIGNMRDVGERFKSRMN